MQAAITAVKAVIDAFPAWYEGALLAGQRAKLGLQPGDDSADRALVSDWLALLQHQGADHTLAWRRLGEAAAGDANPLRALMADPAAVNPWLARWQARCAADDASSGGHGSRPGRPHAPGQPWVIPRNHRVEEALAAASEHGDMGPFDRLLAALRQPWTDDPASAPYAEPAPAALTAGYQTFCGT